MLQSKKLHRVQVNVSSDIYQQLRKTSFQNRMSISEVIRQSLVSSGSVVVSSDTRKRAWSEWMKEYVGKVKGEKDDVQAHDKYAGQIGGWR